MNNREFTTELAKRLGLSARKTSSLISSLMEELSNRWTEGDSITIQHFGLFEVKKKEERVTVHPTTKQRMLVPPKLVLTFKASPLFKEKLKKDL